MAAKDFDKIIRSLIRFGLSGEEAKVYVEMLQEQKALSYERISDQLGLPLEEIRRIMKSLEKEGFVKQFFEEIYLPTTPIEALNKRITTLLTDFQNLKDDIIRVLQPRVLQETLVSCNLDKTHFKLLVNILTKMAKREIHIAASELKFIEETDFLNILERNRDLRTKDVKILFTGDPDTPEIGDIISRLRKLNKSPKVWIQCNPSRTQLRYMTVDKKRALLVEALHENAILINSPEVAGYFDLNHKTYFAQGSPIEEILNPVKDIKNPETNDEEVRMRLKKLEIYAR